MRKKSTNPATQTNLEYFCYEWKSKCECECDGRKFNWNADVVFVFHSDADIFSGSVQNDSMFGGLLVDSENQKCVKWLTMSAGKMFHFFSSKLF